jgi:two-component system, sensor histidine kinase PdtaS
MKNFFVLAFLFSHFFVYQQSLEYEKKEDSLINLVKKTSVEEEKIRLYYQLGVHCRNDDVKKREYFAELLLKSAQKSKSSIGLGLYHINQSNLYFFLRDGKKSLASATKACEILRNTKETNYYLTAIICLSRCYYRTKLDDTLKKLLDQHSKQFHQLGDYKLLGDFYYCYASCFEYTIDKRQSICYKKALYYYRLCKDIDSNAWLFYRIAKSYKRIKLNEEALKYLNIAIELNPSTEIVHMLSIEKAKILNKMGKFNEAKELLKNAKVYFVNLNLASTDVYWMCLLAEANSDFGLKRYNDAIRKCDYILNRSDKEITKINALNTVSFCYYKKGQYRKAKEYIDKAMILIDARKDRTGDLALEEYYRMKSLVEVALGNYNEAWANNTIYIEYLDKTSTKIQKEQYEKYQIEFEVAEKENQIKKFKIEALNKSILVQKQQSFLILSAIVLFFSIIAFFIFILIYRTIKNKNKAIEENVKKLEKSVNEKELLLKEIHHRVKNNFQLVTSLLNIQAREVDSKDLNEFVDKGQSRITSMALIHENLSQTARLDKVNFQDYVQDLIDNIKKTYQSNHDNINSKIEIVNSNFDVQISIPLGLIINELYSNILKHAFPNNEGNIIVELIKKEEKEFQLTIADDGIGFKDVKDSKKKIGLELVYMLVEQLNGTIELIKDNGTKYIINFKEIIG